VDGVIKHTPDERQPWVVNSAITIDDGKVNIVKVKDNFDAQKLPNKNVGCAGPLLVWEGEVQKITDEWRAADTEEWLTTTHPRTAIGLSKDGKTVIQVAVDGRWSKSGWPKEQTAIGMSTELLGKLMRGLGCYKAMNFDGGGGTAMWVYGQGNSRNIVNHVSENRWDWDGTKLRATGNAVYVKSDLKK
jgi:exopolysaccharide biosynthesis protein